MVVGSAPSSHNPSMPARSAPHAGPPPETDSQPLLAGVAPSAAQVAVWPLPPCWGAPGLSPSLW